MASLINSLIDILTEQEGLYKEVTALSLEKKEYIIQNDTEALRAILEKENSAVARALRADKERAGIMDNIAIVLGKEPSDITLSSIIASLKNQDESEALANIAFRIQKAANEMKMANEDNKVLIESALGYIEYSINAIHSMNDDALLYAGDDMVEASSILDING